ncbi:MAG: DUF6132 family protein [Bacteroidota bacterium]
MHGIRMKLKTINRTQVIFILAGALAGFFYWKFVGCTSGTCPLQSHWAGSMLLGSVAGSLLADLYISLRKKLLLKRNVSPEKSSDGQF